jgi:hypothetical protein
VRGLALVALALVVSNGGRATLDAACYSPVCAAHRCLQLILHLGCQQASLAGSAASLQLQDSCCSLLAGLSRAPAVTLALEGNAQLAADLLRLLQRVLHRWVGSCCCWGCLLGRAPQFPTLTLAC